MALEAKTSQALPGILVGKVEVPHQVLCGSLLHVQLISILLVEETNFLQADKTTEVTTSCKVSNTKKYLLSNRVITQCKRLEHSSTGSPAHVWTVNQC